MKEELETILEQLQCAQMNFDTLERMSEVIANHSLYKIPRMQLDEAVKKLEEFFKSKE